MPPARARRRYVLLVALVAPVAGGGAGQAEVARVVPALPRVQVGRRVAGLRAGRRLGRSPIRGGLRIGALGSVDLQGHVGFFSGERREELLHLEMEVNTIYRTMKQIIYCNLIY